MNPGGDKKTRGISILACWMALCTGLTSCGASGADGGGDSTSGDLSLIWISLDTLRADHLGVYGYGRDTSPFMDSLAERNCTFEWAITPQNSTLPTHITMFTGRHPVVHGLMHTDAHPGFLLAPSVRTLPQILHDADFDTRGWVDGGKMAGYYGFEGGFDTYRDRPTTLPSKLGASIKRIQSYEKGQRFFHLLHTYDMHSPLRPPAPYDEAFAPQGPTEAHRKMALYDGMIQYIDNELRKYVKALRETRVLKRTILVITGDHGESFHEYGIAHTGHGGANLHQNITRVPWILVHPDEGYKRTVKEFVGLIDFPNTMLSLLGFEERLPGGVDVLNPPDDNPRTYLSWTGKGSMEGQDLGAWSVYYDGRHLLESKVQPEPERNGLFDVRADPLEKHALEDPGEYAQMRKQLSSRRATLEEEREQLLPELRTSGDLPEEVWRELEGLGYTGDD